MTAYNSTGSGDTHMPKMISGKSSKGSMPMDMPAKVTKKKKVAKKKMK